MIDNNNNFDCIKIKTEPPEEETLIDIKQEPIDIKQELLDIKQEPPSTKSVVLKFKKKIDGNYFVIPLLTPDPFYEVNLEDDKTSIKIKQEKEEKSTKTSSYCQRCSFYAKHEKEKLKRHQQRVHPRKTWKCIFCNRNNFKEKITLQMHLLYLHRDNQEAMQQITKRIFSCKVCTYKSLKKNNFKRHLITHKPKTKNTKSDLKNINKGNPFNCYHCPYGATSKGSIIKHVRLHKPAEYKPYTCTKCNTKYNEKGCLDSHIVKHHLDSKELIASLTSKIYKCEFCNYKDVNKAKVSRHKGLRH
ncbi:unnamed protein product [Ceutorhynchus assimilis]|uniref:C2H2-type domain-containing protein n=1 Tax=Ceutorhynchus assimilis TaxID=467358 RepID=A0A9N9QJC5_9CUCU|nr:unnamed protein product [Ceutorhynchus assimilis]